MEEKECLVVDANTGELFKTQEEALLNQAKEELNKIVEKDRYFTYYDVLEIITRDWPEDKKEEFFGRIKRHEGWVVNKEETKDLLKLDYAKAENGEDVIILRFDCD